MIDLKYIKENPQKIKEIIINRGFDAKKADVDKLLRLEKELSVITVQLNNLRAERNRLSKTFGLKKDKNSMQKAKRIKEQIKVLEKREAQIKKILNEIINWIPNIPLEEVPLGGDETQNEEIKAWIPKIGYVNSKILKSKEGSKKVMPKFAIHGDKQFIPRQHWEIGKMLDIIDIEQGGCVSGSRFYYLKNEAVLIMNGIFHLLTEKLLSEGFILMYVPTLVKERLLYGTSHFPADADQVYKVDSSNVENKRALYLLGSAESSLIGYWMDKVIKKENLPIKATAITTCFRSEAGSWGKDVRGIKRVHQFDKQEMIMIVENSVDQARKAHEYLLSINEWLLQKLELPYRVINMCYGELGYAAAAKKYDYELWLPSQQSFMEVGSNSITTDYQARRLNIRYQDDDKKIKYVYTLNDTGATHRLLIGIIDHYQQSDGSLLVPKVLRKYVGKDKIK